MDKLESMVLEAETVSALMIHLANDDAGDASFAVMSDLGENGTEHECDLGVHETALRASAVIDQLLAELEAKDHAHRVHAARLISERGVLRERVTELEAKLATPVRLPDVLFISRYPVPLMRADQVKEQIRAAGFTVSEE